MFCDAMVIPIYQLTRPLLPVVLTLCCLLSIAGVVFAQEQSATLPPNAVVVSIPLDDEFYFGKTKVSQLDLVEKIKLALKDKPADEQIVYVKAGVSVKYSSVVSVVNAIRASGIDRIGLVADKKTLPDVKPGHQPRPASPVSSGANGPLVVPIIVIDVRSKTRLRLDSKPIVLSQLRIRLEKLLALRESKAVLVKAPRNMSYGDVVKLIDIVKSAGAEPIGLEVDNLR